MQSYKTAKSFTVQICHINSCGLLPNQHYGCVSVCVCQWKLFDDCPPCFLCDLAHGAFSPFYVEHHWTVCDGLTVMFNITRKCRADVWPNVMQAGRYDD